MEKREKTSVFCENLQPSHNAFKEDALSLDGLWQFAFFSSPQQAPEDFYETAFDDSAWDELPVPCCWETRGYGKPCYGSGSSPAVLALRGKLPVIRQKHNSCGLYRKSFELPAHWSGQSIILSFGSAKSSLELWVNGQYAGLSKGSMLPAEFDITSLVAPGSNLIAVRVRRFSEASYLEGQDMWLLSGLYRSVCVYARPAECILDLKIENRFSEDYRTAELSASLTLSFEKKQPLRAALFAPDGTLAAWADTDARKGHAELKLTVDSPLLWSAETPSLYRLQLTLKNGHCREVFWGFRDIHIDNARLLINGRPLKLRGVAYHSFTPDNGYYVPKETLEKDLLTMKHHHINAVRCAHYPQDELFYELCDRYGLYVMDECNLDTHGMRSLGIPGDHPFWTEQAVDRVRRMVLRDRCHPSVVIWSLGNDSGRGSCFARMKEALLELDSSRPVHYEGDKDFSVSDFISICFASPDFEQNYAEQQELTEQPAFFQKLFRHRRKAKTLSSESVKAHPLMAGKFLHSMGNGGTDICLHSRIFEASDPWCGGFIWDYKDKTLNLPDASDADGKLLRANPGDFGRSSRKGDGCCTGITNRNGEPHEVLGEIAKAFQPVCCEFSDDGQIYITNRNSFLSTSAYLCLWRIVCEGSVLASGTLDTDIAPRETAHFPQPATRLPDGRECFLNLIFLTRTDSSWTEAGSIVAEESWLLQAAIPETLKKVSLNITETEKALVLRYGETTCAVNKTTGLISSVNGMQLALTPCFTRAKTDGDLGFSGLSGGAAKKTDAWDKLSLLPQRKYDTVISVKNNSTVIVKRLGGRMLLSYSLASNGALQVGMKIKTDKKPPCRIGFSCVLDKSFDTLEWLGLGPHDCYPGRSEAGCYGFYEQSVTGQDEHPRPQEHGNKSGVRQAALRSNDGRRLEIKAVKTPFMVSALPYTTGELIAAGHGAELPEHHLTELHIDLTQNGLGDCYVPCPDRYKIQADTEYTLRFTLQLK